MPQMKPPRSLGTLVGSSGADPLGRG